MTSKLAIEALQKLKAQAVENQAIAAKNMVEADQRRQQESETWALCREQIESIDYAINALLKSVEKIG